MENKIQATVNNQVTKGDATKHMRDLIKSMEGEIKKALPSVLTPERFTRIALSALSSTPKLSLCDAKSFLGALMNAAQLGLEPNTPLGQAYLIPYGGQCQFQIGYKGLIDLAYRSGEVALIQSHIVYSNDDFEFEYGINPKLSHKPAKSNRGNPIAVYAMFKTKDGGFGFDVMSLDEVREFAKKYSKAYNSSTSPWKTNFEEMAKKTVLKRVLKYAPLKSEFAKQITQDETIKSEIKEDMYEAPDETIYDDVDYTEVNTETGEVKDVNA